MSDTPSPGTPQPDVPNPTPQPVYPDPGPQGIPSPQEPVGVPPSNPSEAPDPVLDLVTFYAQTLGVPERRDVEDANVLAGKAAFYGAGCASCRHSHSVHGPRGAGNPVGSRSAGGVTQP